MPILDFYLLCAILERIGKLVRFYFLLVTVLLIFKKNHKKYIVYLKGLFRLVWFKVELRRI